MIRDWLRGLLLVAALLVAQGWVSANNTQFLAVSTE
jgi:hypothetical protein